MAGAVGAVAGTLGYGVGLAAKPVATAAANAIKKFTSGVKPSPAAVSSNAAACVANSFVPGTRILMADGSSEPIEDLELGDKVLATDPETGTTAEEPVIRLITGSGEKDLVTLTVTGENGIASTVEATAGHPFWVPEQQEWIAAGEVEPGMWLQTSSGTWVMLSTVAYDHRQQSVYNLTIDTIHTFYVYAGDHALLAHNCGEAAAQSGIYVVNSESGTYVGQSVNITRRLTQHVANGKFPQSAADAAETIAVAGTKTDREIAEQMMIDDLGGTPNLLNKINPIGPGRFDLLPDGYTR